MIDNVKKYIQGITKTVQKQWNCSCLKPALEKQAQSKIKKERLIYTNTSWGNLKWH